MSLWTLGSSDEGLGPASNIVGQVEYAWDGVGLSEHTVAEPTGYTAFQCFHDDQARGPLLRLPTSVLSIIQDLRTPHPNADSSFLPILGKLA